MISPLRRSLLVFAYLMIKLERLEHYILNYIAPPFTFSLIKRPAWLPSTKKNPPLVNYWCTFDLRLSTSMTLSLNVIVWQIIFIKSNIFGTVICRQLRYATNHIVSGWCWKKYDGSWQQILNKFSSNFGSKSILQLYSLFKVDATKILLF